MHICGGTLLSVYDRLNPFPAPWFWFRWTACGKPPYSSRGRHKPPTFHRRRSCQTVPVASRWIFFPLRHLWAVSLKHRNCRAKTIQGREVYGILGALPRQCTTDNTRMRMECKSRRQVVNGYLVKLANFEWLCRNGAARGIRISCLSTRLSSLFAFSDELMRKQFFWV